MRVQKTVSPEVHKSLNDFQNKSYQDLGYHGAEESSYWLECDDEYVKVMKETEFECRLNETDGSLMGTPYVLFYHKLVV